MADKTPAIDFSFQSEALAEIRKRLGTLERRAPNVQAQALNKTQTVLKKYLPEQVFRTYTYKARKLQKPTAKRASFRSLSAILYYKRKNIGLENFDFNPGAFGNPRNTPGAKFAAKIRNEGDFKSISRMFKMKTGNEEIIMRRDGSKRLPIRREFGPSESNMVHYAWEDSTTQEFTGKTLAAKLDEQIENQFLKKWGAKR